MRDKLKDIFSAIPSRFIWSESRLILIVAVVIGVLGGLGAVGFRWLIDVVKLIFFHGDTGDNLLSYAWSLPWWQRVLIPTAGGLVLAPMLRYFAKETKGHGVPEVMESIVLHGGKINPRTMFTRALASAITLGSGGSVGREGPIVQIGSALGSTVGQFLRASEGRMKTLVGCGAAAGMAATFNAPLGGALFAIEVILGDFGLAQVTPIIISSVAATVVSRHFLGDFPSFEFHPPPMVSHYEYLFYAVLGLAAGALAWFFVSVLYRSEDAFEKIPLPMWIKPAFGGLAVGIIAIWFPHVFSSGYEAINQALDSQLPLMLLAVLVLIKVLATSLTIASGGSGGVFAPALFQGAMLGGAVGALFNLAFPDLTAPYGSYALAGMGAMIAGTMQAPITVILIIFELTGDYRIILPVMTACILSALLSHWLLGGESIYTRKLIRRGLNLYRGRDLNVLRGLKVSDVMTNEVTTVEEGEPLSTLIRRAITHPQHTYVQVDERGKISGLIPLQKILELMRDDNLRDILVAQDVAQLEFPVLSADETLDEVIRRFGDHGLEEVPVVDPENPGVPVGVVRHNDVMQAYRRAFIQQDMSGFVADSLVRDPDRKTVELVDGYRMVEVEAPWNFRGKTIRELDISRRFGVQVILIRKKRDNGQAGAAANDEEMHFVPRGDDVIEEGDVLVLVGDSRHLKKFMSF
ncbi:MAG: CBS domain-containing protein [Candidatus Glassbacteria bacterium]|nr:CBS domain-containing protein [Candidatus Glassbacteria bacterium]